MNECSVICRSCFDDLIEVINRLNIKVGINRRPRTIREKEKTKYNCLLCNLKLKAYVEYYSEEYFEEKIIPIFVLIGGELSKKIYGCFKCVGAQLDYDVYRWNKDEEDPSNFIENNAGQTVESFLWEKGIDDKFHKLILKHLRCQTCHYGEDPIDYSHNPDGGTFESYDQVYDEHETNSVFGLDDFDFIEFSQFAQKYNIDLSWQELHEFKQHLLKYPLLAYKHETGKKVYDLLQKHYEKRDYIELRSGTQLFRGRARKKDRKHVFGEDEIWNPPEGLPQHGRYNAVGISVLYLSNRMKAIPYEIHPLNDENIDIALFKTRKKLKLFNIGLFDHSFQGFFNEINEESKPLKKAYLLTNYIGNCCAEIGFHGVAYQGVSDRKYTNYALFNFEKNNEIRIVEVVSCEVEIIYNLKTEAKSTKDIGNEDSFLF